MNVLMGTLSKEVEVVVLERRWCTAPYSATCRDDTVLDPEPPPMKYPKRSQYKYRKSQYRVRNWPEYEAGLKRRGDLTVWLSTSALDAWRAPANGKPGGQRKYSELAIETALTIRMVFHLPLRQTEGFLRCLAKRRWCMARSRGQIPHPPSGITPLGSCRASRDGSSC